MWMTENFFQKRFVNSTFMIYYQGHSLNNQADMKCILLCTIFSTI